MSRQANDEDREQPGSQLSLLRFLKIGLLVFGIVIGGVAIAAVFAGDDTDLPFDYEGFD